MNGDRNICGAAMVIAMIFIVITVVAVGGYLFVITKNSNLAKKGNDSIKALYIAEAGIERAVSYLQGQGVWSLGTIYSNVSLGDGTYTAEVIQFINNNKVRLKSTGVVREEDRIITAYVSRPTVFDWGIFSDEEIKLEDMNIDSYNSTQGPYGGINVNQNGDIGTNAIGSDPFAVDMEDSTINGDVAIGPGGDTDTDIHEENSTITGEKSSLDEPVNLPLVIPPGGLPNQGELHLEDAPWTINASGQYDLIKLEGDSTLSIDASGGTIIVYITGEFKLEDTSRINIIGGNVDIYVADSFKMEDSTLINSNTQNPGLLSVYGADSLSELELENNAVFYGAIYAPTAEFEMENDVVLYGSIAALQVNIEGAIVHYDEALAGTGPSTGGPLNVDFWQEKY